MLYSNVAFVDKFETTMLFDNCEPTTLKLKPTLWAHQELFERDFQEYCYARQVDYVLFPEKGDNGNLHYHGIVIYPFDKVRRNFQRWFNKYYGHIYVSDVGEVCGWYRYCTKNHQQAPHAIPYLFDPMYEGVLPA